MTRYLRERTLYGPMIAEPPPGDLGLVIVIPAKDESDLVEALRALHACEQPRGSVEIIVVANTSETDPPDCITHNAQMAENAANWAVNHSRPGLLTHVLQCHDLPKKYAGVGLARKIGMDEACLRLETVGNPGGVIVCFDADSLCDPNYLVELASLFHRNDGCQACSIYFEHPLGGSGFPPAIYEAIALYELHLRYFVHAQRFAGFPFATQTVGSSMAVRCSSYQQQNGMNRRKAGEDFYFLHKFTPLGHVAELNTTRVIPSPRTSHRVPFGTGKAVGEILGSGGTYTTYSPKSFEDLRGLFQTVDSLFDAPDRQRYTDALPENVASYISGLPFWERVEEIRSNVAAPPAFRTRFFRWFNAFLIMKYLHHARDHACPDEEITSAARWLLTKAHNLDQEDVAPLDAAALLGIYRTIDRSNPVRLPGRVGSFSTRE